MSMTQQKIFAADKDTIKSCWSQSFKEGGNGTEDNPDANTIQQSTPQQNTQNPKLNPPMRTDRYGNEIVPRARRLRTGEKTSHKLTFMDKIEKQKEEYARSQKFTKNEMNNDDDAEMMQDGRELRASRAIVSIPSDEHRTYINTHHVLSHKDYNASPEEY